MYVNSDCNQVVISVCAADLGEEADLLLHDDIEEAALMTAEQQLLLDAAAMVRGAGCIAAECSALQRS